MRGRLRSNHVQVGGHIWDLSLNEVNGKVRVALRLHWLLLKGLEHLLKLMKQKQKILRRVEEVKIRRK